MLEYTERTFPRKKNGAAVQGNRVKEYVTTG